MSSVVLDNSVSAPFTASTSTLTANSARLGQGGLISSGPLIAGQGNNGLQSGSIIYNALTISDDTPAGAARAQPSYFTTYASDTGASGLNVNQRQSFAYADPLIAGAAAGVTIQQYEQGLWVRNTTSALSDPTNGSTSFINRPNLQARPLTEIGGTFTGTGATQSIPAAGITAGSRIRFFLLGGTQAAFAAIGGITAPVFGVVSVNAIAANSGFTVTAMTGALYGWECVFA